MEPQTIQLIFTVLSVLIIGYWQYHQIKVMQQQITNYSTLIKSYKDYMSVFNLDEINKNTKLQLENKDLEIRNMMLNQMTADEQFQAYYEMLVINAGLLNFLPEQREQFIDKYVKIESNKKALKETIKHYNQVKQQTS
ncbi:MAG: hypothetical protein H6567_07950 [Lewinellaceae bacterium]|nr:hypothetical protein [Lewinellaceae bacterium]